MSQLAELHRALTPYVAQAHPFATPEQINARVLKLLRTGAYTVVDGEIRPSEDLDALARARRIDHVVVSRIAATFAQKAGHPADRTLRALAALGLNHNDLSRGDDGDLGISLADLKGGPDAA